MIASEWLKFRAAASLFIPLCVIIIVAAWFAVNQIVVPQKNAIIEQKQSRIDALEKENQDLRRDVEVGPKRSRWSQLSREDETFIKDALKNCEKRTVSIRINAASDDAVFYGEQIEALFATSGFPTQVDKIIWEGGMTGSISITPPADTLGEPMATILRKIGAASNRKVNFYGKTEAAKPSDKIEIMVSTR